MRRRKAWRYGRVNRRILRIEIRDGDVEITSISRTGSRHYLTLPRDVWVAALQWSIPLTRSMPSSVDSLEQLAIDDLMQEQSIKKRKRYSDQQRRR